MEFICNESTNIESFKILKDIFEDYNLIAVQRIKDSELHKCVLKDSKPKKCRFCGNDYPKVKFSKVAHVIPEFLGNKSLVSKFECDSCNDFFSKFETELAKFLQVNSVFTGIVVKHNKIPKYKTSEINIENSGDLIHISNLSKDDCQIIDSNNIAIKVKQPTYIPEYIYRCLVKIALSVIPENRLGDFLNTFKWLNNTNSISNVKPYIHFSLYPSSYQSNDIFVSIFQLKENSDKNYIKSLFHLSYKNFSIQTYIPYFYGEKENIQLELFPFIIPSSLDYDIKCYNSKQSKIIDLSSKQKKRETTTYYLEGDNSLIPKI